MPTKYQIINSLYKTFFKPAAFLFDAEAVHDAMTKVGESLESVERLLPAFFACHNPALSRQVLGVTFNNPVGLAGGFDYDGHLAEIMKYVGFGFNTVGTVTAKAYEGNPKPRLGRLPQSRSLLVNKGFKSAGAEAVRARLDQKNLVGHTLGISVGSSNVPAINTLAKAVDDYLFTLSLFQDRAYVKYFELNISCPNTCMTESFTHPQSFAQLVQAVGSMRLKQPVFVKMPNELGEAETDQLVKVALKHGFHGFIFSNLVKDRHNPAFDPVEMQRFSGFKGNFSGKPTESNANRHLRRIRHAYGQEVALIGCGGVFTAEDALAKLAAGADLVQLVTGMIFEGPQIAGQICSGLASR